MQDRRHLNGHFSGPGICPFQNNTNFGLTMPKEGTAHILSIFFLLTACDSIKMQVALSMEFPTKRDLSR